MARTKSTETIKAEAKAKAELEKRIENLAKAKKFNATETFDNLESLSMAIGRSLYMTFLMDDSTIDDGEAIKLIVEKVGEVSLKLRQAFDDNVKNIANGSGNKKLRALTPIRKEREVSTKETSEMSVDELIAQKLAKFNIK